MMRTDDTIVAIATPSGRGGIGVVRVSGSAAAALAGELLARRVPLRPRVATFGRVRGGPVSSGTEQRDEGTPGEGRRPIDQVVCTWFPAPGSYTGEDVVEISGHGNPLVLQRIVERALDCGARLARPGEFTLRAFLNGRLDLVQAEAVADLIDAVSPAQAQAACDQLDGGLTGAIVAVEQDLFALLARLEASLDFPDEGYHFAERDHVAAELRSAEARLDTLASGARAGRLLREGARVVIVGRPNAGKSSLFNGLLASDRAIVTHVPGTTRDLVTERCDVEGVPVTLVDTAGLREVGDVVEREGVARAREAAAAADVVVVAIDGSVPRDSEEFHGVGWDAPRVVAVTKRDLPAAWTRPDADATAVAWVEVSARTGAGLGALRRAILAALGSERVPRDDVLVTNQRHARLVGAALEGVRAAARAVEEGGGEELVSDDVQRALRALQEVTGARASDAVLHEIFSRFCIGK